jgi:hypothetical protein
VARSPSRSTVPPSATQPKVAQDSIRATDALVRGRNRFKEVHRVPMVGVADVIFDMSGCVHAHDPRSKKSGTCSRLGATLSNGECWDADSTPSRKSRIEGLSGTVGKKKNRKRRTNAASRAKPEIEINLAGRGGLVERIKMDARNAIMQEVCALLSGVMDADALDGDGIAVGPF